VNSKALLDWKDKLTAAASSQLIAAETVSEADIDITMGLLINSDPEFRACLISTLCKDDTEKHDHVQARWVYGPKAENRTSSGSLLLVKTKSYPI
jgi:hypothetical protein